MPANWMENGPVAPDKIGSYGKRAVAELIPDPTNRRYEVTIRSGVGDDILEAAKVGTVQSEGRGKEPYLVHSVAGIEYRN